MGRVWFVACVACVVLGCGSKNEDAPPAASDDPESRPAVVAIDARPPAVDAAPVVPEQLVEWATESGDAVTVHAADADGNALRLLLTGNKTVLLTPAVDGVAVTGRASTDSLDSARAALFAAYPALAPVAEPVFAASRSTKIDLRFARAKASDLFRLLADVYGENIVVIAEDLPDVSVAVRAVPVNSFLDAYARVLGVSIDKKKYVWFVRRADDPTPDDALLNLAGPKISIDMHGARAGEVAALVSVLHATGRSAPCDKGPGMTMRVRAAPVGTVLAASSARAGVALADTGPSPCKARALDSAPGAVGTLVAIAEHGKRVVALFRVGSGVAYVEGETTLADGTEVRVLRSVVKVNGADVYLHPDWLADEAPRIDDAVVARSRLTATVIAGKDQHAIVELPDGKPAVISTDRRLDARLQPQYAAPYADVGPGTLRLDDLANAATMMLRRR